MLPARRALQAAWWLLCACALAACGERTPAARLPLLESQATVLAFGDSLTYGTGADAAQSYPAVLARLIGRTVINAGIPGETTSSGLARLDETLDDTDPALMILCLGGNDMLRRQDRAAMQRNLDEIITRAKTRGIAVMLIGVPEPQLGGLETEPGYFELARRHGLPLESAALADILEDADLRADRIHPNARGYALLAGAVATTLREAGAL